MGVSVTKVRLGLGLFVAASIVLGFLLTYRGVATWDALPHLDRSRWLVHKFGLPSSRSSDSLPELMKWYGPLWVLVLGILSEVVFGFLRDPMWVQHAFNFALFPVGLLGVYVLLVRAGVARSTALLTAALIFGLIRLGGHALVNVNDFPFAMACLLVTLYLWNKLRELHRASSFDGKVSKKTLIVLGVVSIVPYLIRPPVVVQVLTLVALLVFYAGFVARRSRLVDRIALPVVPLLSAVLFMAAVWPSLWEPVRKGRMYWRDSFGSFLHFSWVGTVRVFGLVEVSNRLPRWYPFIWWPVIVSPVVFVLLIAGLLGALRNPKLAAGGFTLETRWGPWELSLPRWLAFHTGLFWAGVLLLHPTIYDEERHLLFLYPPVLVLAAFGLDRLSERIKYALAGLVILTSLASYAQWGRYSYVYKSPIIGDRSSVRFSGDYWGVCVPLAVRALPDLVPAGSEVVVPAPYDAAAIQYERLRQGRFSGRPDFGPYLLESVTGSSHFYAILYNRMGYNDRAIEAARMGRGRILWRATMPPGDPACVLVEYSP
jgi:hypothetical protein